MTTTIDSYPTATRTRKQLRAALQYERETARQHEAKAGEQRFRADQAEGKLEELGYETIVNERHHIYGTYKTYDYRPIPAALEARNLETAKQIDQARQDGATEALALVLDALEIKGYDPDGHRIDNILRLYGRDLLDPASLLPTPEAEPNKPRFNTAKFRADLETALRVRAEKRAADTDAATEQRVKNLTTAIRPHRGGVVGTFETAKAPTEQVRLSDADRRLLEAVRDSSVVVLPKKPKKKGSKK